MLIVSRLGETAGAYFLAGPAPGRWIGAGATGLGLDGEVRAEQLRAVLAARDVDSGEPLPLWRHLHRRAGWDLTFAAPKSVSLLAALGPPDAAGHIRAAQGTAVADAVDYLQRRACWAARGRQRALVAVEGLVAAAFDHHRSAAGDPHLHTHVLVANLVRAHDGRMSALAGSPLWCGRGAIAAVYRLSLRAQLSDTFALRWAVESDGTADVVGVPRSAIEAASRRRGQIRDRSDGQSPATQRGKRTLKHLTRASPAQVDPGAWVILASDAGFGREDASVILRRAVPAVTGERHPTGGEVDRALVAAWLADRRSTFAVTDVLAALVATVPGGLAVSQAETWAETFCRGAIPVPGGRWTTPEAQALDRWVASAGLSQAGSGIGVVSAELADAAPAGHQGVSDTAIRSARRLLSSGDGVAVVGGAPGRDRLWGQAETLGVACRTWQAAGYRVAMLAASPAAARRWQALIAIECATGDALTSGDVPAPGVLIVDRADRYPSGELAQLIGWAKVRAVKLVLVEGGTQAARHRPLSTGLAEIGDQLGRVPVGPGPIVGLGPAPPAVRHGNRSASLSGAGAVAQLLEGWQAARAGGCQPLLVGLGPAEVDALNQAVRDRLLASGEISGPVVTAAGRPYQPGDRVLGLRRGTVAAGTIGRVTATDPAGGTVTVDWGVRHVTLDRHQAARISHAYATTPAMLRLVYGPVLVLGDPRDLGAHRERVLGAALVTPVQTVTYRGNDRMSRLAERALASRRLAPDGGWPAALLPLDRPVAELTAWKQRLAAALGRDLPEDPDRQRRLLEDDRHWLAARGEHEILARRQAQLDRMVAAEDAWVTAHGDQLRQWQAAGRAIEARTDALSHLLATDPGDRRRVGLGPRPEAPAELRTWLRAIREVAALDDRWPGAQLEATTPGLLDGLRRDAARRPLDRGVDGGLGLG